MREEFALTGYFYNPNIAPTEEFARRRAALEEYARSANLTVIHPPYLPSEWFSRIAGLEQEPEGGTRCLVCFRMRLERAAAQAGADGYDYFATTLTVGPRKCARTINSIGWQLAEHYGVQFYEADFKKQHGFTRSVELSKILGLYRQSYCGCIYSMDVTRRPVGSEGACE